MTGCDATDWKRAMNEELALLAANNTWTLVSLSLHVKKKKPIPCRWVVAIKQNSDGSIDRYKARLVAKGFKQHCPKRQADHCYSATDINRVPMFADNQGAIKVITHPIASSLTKHIDLKHHFARERVARGEITFNYCTMKEMVADALTKTLPKPICLLL
jgi:hypothetical protein